VRERHHRGSEGDDTQEKGLWREGEGERETAW
jgi:hypothetical protein